VKKVEEGRRMSEERGRRGGGAKRECIDEWIGVHGKREGCRDVY
jgi:hypothetical protein